MSHFPDYPIPQEEIDATEPSQKPDPVGWWLLAIVVGSCVAMGWALEVYL